MEVERLTATDPWVPARGKWNPTEARVRRIHLVLFLGRGVIFDPRVMIEDYLRRHRKEGENRKRQKVVWTDGWDESVLPLVQADPSPAPT